MATSKGTGWLARQQAAKAALAAREGGAHPVYDNAADRARREMIAAQAAADRAYAEAVERQRAVMMIECPCCTGRGIVLLSDGAKMVEAVRRYDFAGWRPDADTLARLLPLAVAVNGAGERITGTETTEAQAVEVKKAKARHIVPPFLNND